MLNRGYYIGIGFIFAVNKVGFLIYSLNIYVVTRNAVFGVIVTYTEPCVNFAGGYVYKLFGYGTSEYVIFVPCLFPL